jgi:hypothetical protein
MTFGFVIIRHVCNSQTDQYWKKSYECIRNWYPDTPILIIDDSSHREYLKEDILTTNCTTIYDTTHKGSAELLPYYYFHLLRPFDTAIIIHDSVFIQQYINFTLKDNEPCRFLWSFQSVTDHTISTTIEKLLEILPSSRELLKRYHQKTWWRGCFGVMTIIKWDFLDHINRIENIFTNWLPIVTSRHYRHALERCMAILLIHYFPKMRSALYGEIHKYITWGITFEEYLLSDWSKYPLMKVWTSR